MNGTGMGQPGVPRLDLAAYRPKPYAPGPYKLTPAEGAALMERVRESMPSDQFRRLKVLEVLDRYQDAKQVFLAKAMVREPLRFAGKATS